MPVAEKIDRHGRQFMDIPSILFAQNRMVFITEPITDALASDVIQQLLYLASVSNEDITMVINSPGGSVTAGLALYDTMQGLSCDVSTVCLGMAASMGAFLLAAGAKGKRYVSPNSEVMIHQVMGGASGQAVDVQIAAARIGRMKNTLNTLLSQFTDQPLERIQLDTDRDCFMSAQEAIQYGMADEIRTTLIQPPFGA